MATHSSTLAWRIPGSGEPGGLPSMGSHREAWRAAIHGVTKSQIQLPTLCDPIDGSPPGSPVPGLLQARVLEWVAIAFSLEEQANLGLDPVHHQLPEFTQTHVHRVGNAIQPSHPLSSPSPPALNPSQIRVFSNESTLHRRWPKYWSFSQSCLLSLHCLCLPQRRFVL